MAVLTTTSTSQMASDFVNNLNPFNNSKPVGDVSDLRGLYDYFYNSLLITSNSLPIQSLWILFFTSYPSSVVNMNQIFEDHTVMPGWNTAVASNLRGAKGALFAQAVKIPGDGVNISRIGPENTGLRKGLISNGRKELEVLNVSFLETNTSFADLVLRPWTIAVGYKGLKDPTLKTTITVINLAKNGPGKQLIPRKIFTFYDACPISIDQEQYDYGPNSIKQRQIDFAYNTYTIQSGEKISESGALMNFFTTIFGSNPIQDLTQRVAETVIDLVKGTGEQILTNTAGSINGAVENFIQQGQSFLRGGANNLSSSINGAVNNAIGSITGSNANKDNLARPGSIGSAEIAKSLTNPFKSNPALDDTPYGGKQIASGSIKEIKVGSDDTMNRKTNLIVPIKEQPTETRWDVNIPDNDTPTFNTTRSGGDKMVQNLAQRGAVSSANGDTVTTGNADQTTIGVIIDSTDTPLFIKPGTGIKIEGSQVGGESDTPVFASVIQNNTQASRNDVPNTKSTPSEVVNIQQDTLDGLKVSSQQINIKSDTIDQFNPTNQVNIKPDDNGQSKRISLQEVTIPRNTLDSLQIPVQIVTIKKG